MGVLLGGLIGLILLIAVPRSLGGGAAATTEASTSAASTSATSSSAPAASAPATEGTASAGAGASGEQAPGTTSNATEASTAAEANESVQTEASGSAGTPTAEGDAAAGKEKFAGTCAGCHGANAEGGMGGMAPKLDQAKAWSDAEFAAAVREGKAPEKTLGAAMPHFAEGQVSAEELANIHAFLKTVN